MAQQVFGNLTLKNQGQLQWADSDSSNYVAFRSAATVSSNIVWTLPAVDSTGTQALVSNGSAVLSWSGLVTSFAGLSGAITLTDSSDVDFQTSGQDVTAVIKSTAISGKTAVTIASGDELLISDVSDSGNLKKVTAQNIADLATLPSFKSNWVTADTATKAFTHNLNSLDVLVQIVDVASGETIEIDSVVRTSVNVVTVTANKAPPAGNWRVLILKV